MAVTYEQVVERVKSKAERTRIMCYNCSHSRNEHEKFIYPDRMQTDYKKCEYCSCEEFTSKAVNALDLVEWIEAECKREGINLENESAAASS